MAMELSRSKLFTSLRGISSSHTKRGACLPHQRGYHIDLGAREKALLEEDSALKRFKSYKNTVKRVSKAGDALTILVIAGYFGRIQRILQKARGDKASTNGLMRLGPESLSSSITFTPLHDGKALNVGLPVEGSAEDHLSGTVLH